ncbi:hypothetical protein EVAR_62752_1 [Eumeta japonica]|uniref:Uncharacterized protein n=1 Tax=Eumeta variegata TaxID=151549 RepID=A0A4C1ZBF3_EUMVA|nr:hypothetical protein EVAR_62752_1 [Eumeta japonica]
MRRPRLSKQLTVCSEYKQRFRVLNCAFENGDRTSIGTTRLARGVNEDVKIPYNITTSMRSLSYFGFYSRSCWTSRHDRGQAQSRWSERRGSVVGIKPSRLIQAAASCARVTPAATPRSLGVHARMPLGTMTRNSVLTSPRAERRE